MGHLKLDDFTAVVCVDLGVDLIEVGSLQLDGLVRAEGAGCFLSELEGLLLVEVAITVSIILVPDSINDLSDLLKSDILCIDSIIWMWLYKSETNSVNTSSTISP